MTMEEIEELMDREVIEYKTDIGIADAEMQDLQQQLERIQQESTDLENKFRAQMDSKLQEKQQAEVALAQSRNKIQVQQAQITQYKQEEEHLKQEVLRLSQMDMATKIANATQQQLQLQQELKRCTTEHEQLQQMLQQETSLLHIIQQEHSKEQQELQNYQTEYEQVLHATQQVETEQSHVFKLCILILL